MGALQLVQLAKLMEKTRGRPEIAISLIDGPVATTHPDLVGQNIREIPGNVSGSCSRPASIACMHATFVAGILCGRRGSVAPAICPGCTLLVRPIFSEASSHDAMPSASPAELAEAVIDSVNAGGRVLNLSAALAEPSSRDERQLEEALNHAARQGVIVVAAAGNQGTLGSSAITRHPAVIPVAACDLQARPLNESNLGSSVGRQGLSAPGQGVTSLGTDGKPRTFGGTSAAAPFVTGTIALLWSEFPGASAAAMKLAVTQFGGRRRNTIVPPLLDAWAAYEVMTSVRSQNVP